MYFFFLRLCDSRLTPSLSISEKREMKGIGVGQRPGGVAGIIINLHDQNSAVYAVTLEMCKKSRRRRKDKKRKEPGLTRSRFSIPAVGSL